jgi:hypothetical protein
VADLPTPSAKNETGEYDRFKNFMQRLIAVPHSEIKAQLDYEKKQKLKKKASASRAPGASKRER